MLCLSRKIGEDIVIGDSVTVRVIVIDGSRVVLGITAPKNIPVHRGEVAERIREEIRIAAEAACGGDELDGTHGSEEGEW